MGSFRDAMIIVGNRYVVVFLQAVTLSYVHGVYIQPFYVNWEMHSDIRKHNTTTCRDYGGIPTMLLAAVCGFASFRLGTRLSELLTVGSGLCAQLR